MLLFFKFQNLCFGNYFIIATFILIQLLAYEQGYTLHNNCYCVTETSTAFIEAAAWTAAAKQN